MKPPTHVAIPLDLLPHQAVYGPPRKRLVRPTGLLWALLFVLALLLGGVGAAVVRAEDPEPEATRYVPSARGGREVVRELAEQHFAPESIGWVLATARCESGYDLYAHSAGFDRRLGVWYAFWGALQVDAVTWAGKARALFDGDLSEPAVNFAMASWILTNYGPSHWPYCGR